MFTARQRQWRISYRTTKARQPLRYESPQTPLGTQIEWVSQYGLMSPSTFYRSFTSFRRRVFPVNHLHWHWQPNKINQETEHKHTKFMQCNQNGPVNSITHSEPNIGCRTDTACFSRQETSCPFFQPWSPHWARAPSPHEAMDPKSHQPSRSSCLPNLVTTTSILFWSLHADRQTYCVLHSTGNMSSIYR